MPRSTASRVLRLSQTSRSSLDGPSPFAGAYGTPAISSFALQYSNANASFTALQNSSVDLFITDGNPFGSVASRAFSDANVAALQAQGRLVVGYVNVAVTDDARYY